MSRAFIVSSFLLVVATFFWMLDGVAYLTIDGGRPILIPGRYCVFIDSSAFSRQETKEDLRIACGAGKVSQTSYLPVEILWIEAPLWVELSEYKHRYGTDNVRIESTLYDILTATFMILVCGVVSLRWIFYVRKELWNAGGSIRPSSTRKRAGQDSLE
jgi:hypothetical protein